VSASSPAPSPSCVLTSLCSIVRSHSGPSPSTNLSVRVWCISATWRNYATAHVFLNLVRNSPTHLRHLWRVYSQIDEGPCCAARSALALRRCTLPSVPSSSSHSQRSRPSHTPCPPTRPGSRASTTTPTMMTSSSLSWGWTALPTALDRSSSRG